MDPLTIGLITLRSVAALFTLQGKPEISDAINAMLEAHAAGRNVDAYMQQMVDKMKAGEMDGWAEITNKIKAEVGEFLSRGEGGAPE